MKRKALLFVALVWVFIGTLAGTFEIKTVRARTIVVPDDYSTIQQAVDVAVNGDTVFVKAGTYLEEVVIQSKSISLIGEDASNTIIRNNRTDAG